MPHRLLPHYRLLSLSCAIIALPGFAMAQTVTLDTVVVTGGDGSGTGPVTGYVARDTTSGSKTDTPLIEIPQSISVVTTEQLEDRGVQNLGEALNYTAGVVTQPFGNDSRFFAPIIRGFDAKDNIYLNNFRFVRDFGALSPETYGQERIEVVKGPASVLYGQAVPGGIVNLIQKRPTGTTFREAVVELGSDNRYVGKVDLGGVSANEAVSYRLTGVGRLADTQQDDVEDNRLYIAPTIIFEPDADTSLTVLSSLQYDKANSPFGLPQAGTLDFNPNGEIPASRYLGEKDFDQSEFLTATVGYEFRHRFNEQVEVRQNAQLLYTDIDYQNLYYSGFAANQRSVLRGASVQAETQTSFGIDNQLESKFDTGALQHTLLVGLDHRRHEQNRSSNFTTGQTPIDAYNPVHGSPVFVDPTKTTVKDLRLNQTGLYASDQIKFDRLVTTLGIRQDWSKLEDTLTGSQPKDTATTWRVGTVYLFDNGLAPYISYSTSFDPIIGTTTAGDLYKPTEGEQIEGGLKFQPEGWDSFVTASLYSLTRTNVVATQAETVNGLLTNVRSQTGEVRSQGFELEGTASLAAGLDLIAAYTYTDAEILEGTDTLRNGIVTATTTGNQPANVPEHSASLWVNYTLQPQIFSPSFAWLEGVSVGAGVRYLGERYGNDSNLIHLPSATLFDAAIRYERDNFKASLNVNNIADDDYVASCNFGCFYGEGRTVLGSIALKW